MSIQTYKTKSGKTRYRVNVTVGRKLNGSLDRRTKVCNSLKAAKLAQRELDTQNLLNGGTSDRITFGEFVDTYYMPVKREALKKTTIKHYSQTLKNHIMPTFRDTPIVNIRRLDIQSLLSCKDTHKIAKDTKNILRQVLSEAVMMEVIQNNPASGRFRLPDRQESDRNCSGEWISDVSLQQRVISLATEELKPVLVLGFCFGLRKSEILGLDWKDIDFTNKTITIKQAYTFAGGEPSLETPKTPESRRIIPMSDYAAAELKQIRGKTARIGAVCVQCGHRMAPYGAQKLMKAFTKKNDIPKITCASLRHSFATAAVRGGMPVELLSKILGHTNIITTYNRYVKPLKDDVLGAVEYLNRANLAAKNN